MMLNEFKMMLLSSLLISFVSAASFDCQKASSDVEKLICSDSQLSLLDEDLAKAYKSALQKDPTRIKTQQQRWLKYTRNDCITLDCLTDAYRLQIDRLNGNTLRQERSRSKWAGEYTMDGDTLTIEPSLHFSYSSIGGNEHLCIIEGKFTEVMGKLKFDDNNDDCHITVAINAANMDVNITPCRYYCGANAYTTSGNFIKKQ
ncbi:MAG: DUF1311 domain-containing protein [Campylobacterales bacterium]|nr:DUF1311 domain-containing protein [Campylobacterales bacterium]